MGGGGGGGHQGVAVGHVGPPRPVGCHDARSAGRGYCSAGFHAAAVDTPEQTEATGAEPVVLARPGAGPVEPALPAGRRVGRPRGAARLRLRFGQLHPGRRRLVRGLPGGHPRPRLPALGGALGHAAPVEQSPATAPSCPPSPSPSAWRSWWSPASSPPRPGGSPGPGRSSRWSPSWCRTRCSPTSSTSSSCTSRPRWPWSPPPPPDGWWCGGAAPAGGGCLVAAALLVWTLATYQPTALVFALVVLGGEVRRGIDEGSRYWRAAWPRWLEVAGAVVVGVAVYAVSVRVAWWVTGIDPGEAPESVLAGGRLPRHHRADGRCPGPRPAHRGPLLVRHHFPVPHGAEGPRPGA